jgi:glutamate-1-semialdehyde 2,1-aminomutase
MPVDLHPIARDIMDRYIRRTPGSRRHAQEAQKRLPGGDTRRASYYEPYPLFLERGRGYHVYDCDGSEYLDFQNNYTSLIHGHADPRVSKAAHGQIDDGIVLGSAAEIQYRHAEHLCERIPAMEMVRYCNSGTEATMFCIRAARAFTGRHMIVKMDGGYHGQHELAQVNLFPDLDAAGPPKPWAQPWIPPGVVKEVQVVPFNDLEAAEEVFERHQGQIAGLLMEPMFGAGGLIAPRPGYLRGVRELTRRHDVLLIFDEIMVFRLSRGGMQEAEGVDPDLTSLGKIIGGGFPVGAFGGRREIMEWFDPRRERSVFHSGTFAGNNVTLAAGLANLQAYDTPEIERLNRLGDRLREGFARTLKEARLKGHVTGIGSLINVHWLDKAPRDARDTAFGMFRTAGLPGLLNLELINRGIFSTHRGMFCLSTPMTEREVDTAIQAFAEALQVLRPYVSDMVPSLIA